MNHPLHLKTPQAEEWRKARLDLVRLPHGEPAERVVTLTVIFGRVSSGCLTHSNRAGAGTYGLGSIGLMTARSAAMISSWLSLWRRSRIPLGVPSGN